MSTELLANITKDLLETIGCSPLSVTVSSIQRTVVSINLTPEDATFFVGGIGDDTESFRALTTLIRRLYEERGGEGQFTLDINGVHEARFDVLRKEARIAAQKVRFFHTQMPLRVMSPYERLVIHELFFEDKEIETLSEGEGEHRHIVLRYTQGKKNKGK